MTVEAAASEVVVHQAGTGPGTWAMGSLFEHLVAAGQTGGRLGMSLVTQPPGTATPLHRHTREAEALFLLEGRISYRAGEELHELEDGAFLFLPQGLPHAFRVRGTAPARFLALTTPGGLMGLYDEVGIPAQAMRLPGPDGLPMAEEIARWNEVGPRYGLEVVGPPLPE
jgi:quercetin dioxygenase-like cupin family protein